MKQLNLFHEKKSGHRWFLYCDGAARNNPGPAGAGIVLSREDTRVIEKGFYLGNKTNNQAEYLALLLGLYYAQPLLTADDVLHIRSDSQLLVRQLSGAYRVKDIYLKDLHRCALGLLHKYHHVIDHVLRAENSRADALANEGIDRKLPVPEDFLSICPGSLKL